MIKDLNVDGGRVSFTFELTTPACPVRWPAAAVPGSPQAEAFRDLVRKLAAQVSIRAFRRLPVIQVR